MSGISCASKRHASRAARLACTAGLTAALTLGGAMAPMGAYAATSETTSKLASLQQQVNDAASTFQTATDKANELNEQVENISDEILSLEQDKIPEQQEKASKAASDLYKMQKSGAELISKLFTANSFSDFITLTKYASTIQEDSAAELDSLNELKSSLNSKMDELNSAKDQADQELQKASDALETAKSAASEMQSQASAEDAAEQAAAQQAMEQAAALESQSTASTSSDTAAQTTTNTSSTQSSSASSSSSVSSSSSSSSSTSTDTTGWLTGSCSAYGSTSDGTLGGTTSRGSTVTSSSMGVAMPSNIAGSYYGRSVQISYGGKSCIAVVNDCGGFGGYGRTFDLQPGVWRALGASSCEDWGVRTVSYRWL